MIASSMRARASPESPGRRSAPSPTRKSSAVWRSGRPFAEISGAASRSRVASRGCTSSAREEDQILETIAAARSPTTSATLPETGTAAVQRRAR
jgi:hypothetical protein